MTNSKEMKYVLDRDSLKFVIFSVSIKHSDMGRYWTSAGFCRIYTNDNGELAVSCYGRSDSLGLISDGPEDSEFLTNAIREMF